LRATQAPDPAGILIFQYFSYKTEPRSYGDRLIPVAFILTSHVPAEYNADLLSRCQESLEAFIGPRQTLVSGSMCRE